MLGVLPTFHPCKHHLASTAAANLPLTTTKYRPPLTHIHAYIAGYWARERQRAYAHSHPHCPPPPPHRPCLSSTALPIRSHRIPLQENSKTPPLLPGPAILATPTSPSSLLIYILAPHRLSLPVCHAIGTVPRPNPQSSILSDATIPLHVHSSAESLAVRTRLVCYFRILLSLSLRMLTLLVSASAHIALASNR
jgi:hypothetical protein